MIKLNREITFGQRDEFNRKSIAEKILILLNSDIDISPLIIDGGWGTGKTEFCYKLMNLYEEKYPDSPIVYIDAFKSDHSDEPIMTILASIISLFPEHEREKIIKKALPALRFGVKTIAKAGVGWILKQNADDLAEEFSEMIKDSSNAAIDNTVESLLKDHIDSEKNIKTLQTALADLSKDKKIIVFIDELDRCRPNFAISVLENIKHVFDIQNVSFVLITNTQQLQAAINKSYGYTVDSKKYLDKFIKFTCLLPDRCEDRASREMTYISVLHWLNLVKNSEALTKIHNYTVEIHQDFIHRITASLREIETYARYLAIYQLTSQAPITADMAFLKQIYSVLSVYLCCFHRDLVRNILNDNFKIDDICNAINLKKINFVKIEYPEIFPVAIYGLNTEYKHTSNLMDNMDKDDIARFDQQFESFTNSSRIRADHYQNIFKRCLYNAQLTIN